MIKSWPKFFTLLAMFCTLLALNAQPIGSLDQYLANINQALTLQNSEIALQIINQALIDYPQNVELIASRATIYFTENFNQLALKDFLLLEKLHYGLQNSQQQYFLYSSLTELYNRLDDPDAGLVYAQELYGFFPDDERAAEILLWGYAKAMKNQEGIRRGEEIIEKYPSSYVLKSLLSLIYANTYQYDEATKLFKESVALAERDTLNDNFLLIAYYNQHLLELVFYNYENAKHYLELANKYSESPEIYRSWGYIYHLQLNYTKAYQALQKSITLERQMHAVTPLSQLELIQLYLTFGYTERAEQGLKELQVIQSISWLQYYSMNANDYYKEFYEYYSILWEQKRLKQRYKSKTLREHVLSPFFSIYAKFNQYYYLSKAKAFALANGNMQFQTNNLLPAYTNYLFVAQKFNLHERFFLTATQDYKHDLVGKETPLYTAQQAVLNKDLPTLYYISKNFNATYEKLYQNNVLQDTIKIEKNRTAKKALIENLYEINKGITSLYGLPIYLSVIGENEKIRGDLEKFLKECFNLEKTNQNRYILDVHFTDDKSYYILYDSNVIIKNGEFAMQTFESRRDLANAIAEEIYSE